MTAPSREQMRKWALSCGLIDHEDVDNNVVDVFFDGLKRFRGIDLQHFAELAYAAGQTAEQEANIILNKIIFFQEDNRKL